MVVKKHDVSRNFQHVDFSNDPGFKKEPPITGSAHKRNLTVGFNSTNEKSLNVIQDDDVRGREPLRITDMLSSHEVLEQSALNTITAYTAKAQQQSI